MALFLTWKLCYTIFFPKETQMQPKILCDRKMNQGWKDSSPSKDASQ